MRYYRKDTPLPSFLPLPRFLLGLELSVNAKLLYGLLLNRTTLSQRSDEWVDPSGRVFLVYPIRDIARDLGRSERTVNSALSELERAELLTRTRRGWSQPSRIYLQMPDDTKSSAGLDAQDMVHPTRKICAMDTQETARPDAQFLPPSNTERKQTEEKQTEGERRDAPAHRLGEYRNVRLTEEELERLQTDFPDRYRGHIERLSVYMAVSGKRYADHAAVLRKWLAEDASGSQTDGCAAGYRCAGTGRGRFRTSRDYDYDEVYEEGECL
ncbi:replication initiator protein A [Pseudoflavonifractor sp. MSJ-37]|uniref:replication initiator protein A n=1 Tax=Pseudoflavonifractor sp. MSJ-37 TaxID=2841531 RepID=UPI001C101EC1|nr:replication initiator protein A [Pseudoflavonifractor sp. MSJ-37]MBU5434520.1 replication initiator protein A [Pseudoflavonifractor sp. MSJ-37]